MKRSNLDLSQTIFALASGRLPSAVAIVKISGPWAMETAAKIFVPAQGEFAPIRGMFFGKFHDTEGKLIDSGMLLSFVAPHSHTGEDTVEFHLHGSISVVEKIETVLMSLGVRPAEKGEFTYRALLNGKMLPEEVDTLGDVFASRRAADLERIYSRKEESLRAQIEELRSSLLRVQAILDTSVDFSEEYSSVVRLVEEPLDMAIHGCSVVIQRYQRFISSSEAPRIVLAGRPNAGKSSLFNALVGRYRAIVHENPGTTRDVIEEEVALDGSRWRLVDTAGVRVAEGEQEKQGISLGEDYLAGAELWVLVVDGTQGLQAEEKDLLERFGRKPHVIAWNKKDQTGWKHSPEGIYSAETIEISAKTSEGLSGLWERLTLLSKGLSGVDYIPGATQTGRLKHLHTELIEMRDALRLNTAPEIIAERNRMSLGLLEGVLGEVSMDDVLDRVFGEFCIGK